MTIELPFYKVHKSVADPVRKTPGSACFDLPISLRKDFNMKVWYGRKAKIEESAMVLEDTHAEDGLILMPERTYLIPTGIVFDIPEGYHVQIHLRSSTGLKKHLCIPSHIGIIDSDYVEEVHVPLNVLSDSWVKVKNGDYLAQAMLVKNVEESLKRVKNKPVQKTSRTGGFGSTGN